MHLPAGTVGPVMQIINGQSCHHIQTDYLICYANHLTGFYMMAI